MKSCKLNIFNEKEVKDQAKNWKAVGVFWWPLDLAYKAVAVQALYALYAKSNGNHNTWTL